MAGMEGCLGPAPVGWGGLRGPLAGWTRLQVSPQVPLSPRNVPLGLKVRIGIQQLRVHQVGP